MNVRKSYANKKNRDAKAKDLQMAGFLVRKSSLRNQLCDPRYMEDWIPEMGNDYQTWFKAVYVVEAW